MKNWLFKKFYFPLKALIMLPDPPTVIVLEDHFPTSQLPNLKSIKKWLNTYSMIYFLKLNYQTKIRDSTPVRWLLICPPVSIYIFSSEYSSFKYLTLNIFTTFCTVMFIKFRGFLTILHNLTWHFHTFIMLFKVII